MSNLNQGKRGPKPYQPDSNRLMPFPMIAKNLGCSERAVYYNFASAMRKMRAAGYRLLTEEFGSMEVR